MEKRQGRKFPESSGERMAHARVPATQRQIRPRRPDLLLRDVCGRPGVRDVQRDAIRRFGVIKRQVNGPLFDVDPAVAAWRGRLAWRDGDLGERIDAHRRRGRARRLPESGPEDHVPTSPENAPSADAARPARLGAARAWAARAAHDGRRPHAAASGRLAAWRQSRERIIFVPGRGCC